jgi:hypothetical protein
MFTPSVLRASRLYPLSHMASSAMVSGEGGASADP